MADQIYAPGPMATPAEYQVPGSSSIVPIAVQALLDGTNASGDFVPTLIFRSQAGHVIARVPTDTTVAAGGSAEVSWFPGVKSAGGGVTTATANEAFVYLVRSAPASGQPLQTIPSGAVTAVVWKGVSWHGGTLPGTILSPSINATTLTWGQFGPNVVTLTVLWPAGAYDRYIELTIANPRDIGTIVSPRLRTSVTPDGDRMTLTIVLNGSPVSPTTLTANVFQASGVDQLINAEMALRAVIPGVDLA